MGLLDGRVCVITGGAGSLGVASARLFLDEGAKVMLVDLDGAALARSVADLASPNVDAVAADVSQMIPLARHARPEEIARSALYLASDLSSFVTATTLMVDGGMRG